MRSTFKQVLLITKPATVLLPYWVHRNETLLQVSADTGDPIEHAKINASAQKKPANIALEFWDSNRISSSHHR
jgi:hypothetical protein